METNRFLVLLAAIWFQKPAFEWVWKLFPDTDGFLLTGFQKPAFERVWKHLLFKEFSITECPAFWFQKPAFERVWKL